MIKSLVLSLSVAASLALAFPVSAAVLDQPLAFDLVQPGPVAIDGCSVPLDAADMIFVEATTGCDLVMAELTGLCLVPAPPVATIVAVSHAPGTPSPTCTPIRASPD